MECENCQRLSTEVDTLLTKLNNIRRWVKEKFDEEIPLYFSFEISAKTEEGPIFPYVSPQRDENIQEEEGELEDSFVKIEPPTPQPNSDSETDYEDQDDALSPDNNPDDYQPEEAHDSSNSSSLSEFSEPMDSDSSESPKPNPIAKSSRASRLESRKKKQAQNEEIPKRKRVKKAKNPLKKRIFICEHCSKPCTRRDQLRIHIKRCLSIKDVICQYCNVGFYSSQSLKNHINAKHLKIRDFKCPHCDAEFYLKFTLDYHLKSKHPQPGDNRQGLMCAVCGAVLKTKRTLQAHIRHQHEGKRRQQIKREPSSEKDHERPFACDWEGCGKSSRSKSNLINHIKSVHKKINRKQAKKDLPTFKCNVPGCDASYIQIYQYNKHMKSHHASGSGVSTSKDPGNVPNPPQMDCPICGKTFKKSQNLKIHTDKVHRNKGSMVCNICGKLLKSKLNFGYHMMKIHPEAFNPEDFQPSLIDYVIPNKTYHCEICGHISRFRSAFNHHLQTHVEGGFKCEKCNLVLKTKCGLREHNKTVHLRIKNFVCSIEGCGKAFSRNYKLKNHQKCHALGRNLPINEQKSP